jgi:uncharacterized protein YeaO (DUF488 family)
VEVWQRELAPSDELRRWYGHDPTRFARFRERYRLELLDQRDALAALALQAERSTITLLHAAKETGRSNAAVLKELIEEVLEGRSPTRLAGRRSPNHPRRGSAPS